MAGYGREHTEPGAATIVRLHDKFLVKDDAVIAAMRAPHCNMAAPIAAHPFKT